jgi:hypothetical protein
VKNLTVWKQSKFFGGVNDKTPQSQLGPNEAKEIINMFPNVDGSELLLRTGFREAAWTSGANHSDFVKSMSVLACKTSDQDAIFRVDGMLHAELVDDDLVLFVSIPDNTADPYLIPTRANIVNEQIWTSGGTAPGGGIGNGGEIETPVEDLVGWNTGVQNKVYTPALDSDFLGVHDFWVDDDSDLDPDHPAIDAGNNASTWLSESGALDDTALIDQVTYLSNWPLNGYYSEYNKSDVWYGEPDMENHPYVFKMVSNTLGVGSPFSFAESTIVGDSVHTSPTPRYPSVTFGYGADANTQLNVLFSYSADYVGIAARAYYRDSSKSEIVSPFVLMDARPVYLNDQTEFTGGDVSKKFPMSNTSPSYITVTKKIPYSSVQVKVEFLPTDFAPYNEYPSTDTQYQGGLLIGYILGPLETL